MEDYPSALIERLLDYRANEFEKCLALGRISLSTLCVYKELANAAASVNPLAEYLPKFTQSLNDQQGSRGDVENGFIEELWPLRDSLDNKDIF